MKLHQLRDLIAVVDCGSIRSAARRLNTAQSAVTKSIQQLERELDVPLFERHKHGVMVTPMGALLVQRARAATTELARGLDELSQHRGVGVGQVTVSLSTVPHIALLPLVIQPFMVWYPGVRLTVLEALGFHRVEAEMRSGAVDVYIGVAPTSRLPTAYRVETLFRNRRCIIARAGHPLANASSLRQLVDANWLASSVASADA
ncbi:MAG: LysR family transcriptional regulator, partial [Thermomicrobiales bacterium]|nr:LysR family transcriptional regulator [Thermomicrobiales bacterium]